MAPGSGHTNDGHVQAERWIADTLVSRRIITSAKLREHIAAYRRRVAAGEKLALLEHLIKTGAISREVGTRISMEGSAISGRSSRSRSSTSSRRGPPIGPPTNPPTGRGRSASRRPTGRAELVPVSSDSDGLLAPGALLGPYRIVRVLGRGGMGVVYQAVDGRLQRHVALKTISGCPDAVAVERFCREARAVAKLRHPAIVAVHEAETYAGVLVVVLEFVEGETLEERIARDGPLSPEDAARLVSALARGVAAAHEAGIVHRDLKPANVLLDTAGRPRLTDFGLARDRGQAGGSVTTSGEVVGTPRYMAPEQILDTSAIGFATDVYGLGAVLYEALTARAPFVAASAVEVMERVCDHPVDRPSDTRGESGAGPVPDDLEAICLHALEKRPGDRYASARELADDLGAFLVGQPVAARPVGSLERLRRAIARRRAAASMGLALVLLVAAVALGLSISAANERAAVAAAEAAKIASARADAEEALERLDARREAASGHDELVELGLAARDAAQRFHTLAPLDEAARALRHRAALRLGDAAIDAEQWPVASRAFKEARELGVDDAPARAGLQRLEVARREVEERNAAAAANVTEVAAMAGADPDDIAKLGEALARGPDDVTRAQLDQMIEEWTPEQRREALQFAKVLSGDDTGSAPTGIEEVDTARKVLEALPPDAIGKIIGALTGKEPSTSDGEGGAENPLAKLLASALNGSAEDHEELFNDFGKVFGGRRNPKTSEEREIERIEDWIEDHPDQVAADDWVALAAARAKRSDWAGVLAACQAALNLEPEHAEAFLERSNARAATEDVPGARADLERFLALAPDHERAGEARSRLETMPPSD